MVYLIDQIPLPGALRDSTVRDAWVHSWASTRATLSTPPGNVIVALLLGAYVVMVGRGLWGVSTTPAGWMTITALLTAQTVAAVGILTAALWLATLISERRTISHPNERRIRNDHSAVTLIERHRPGRLPTWELGSHYASPRRQGHGSTFRAMLLAAALPVAYPAGAPARAEVIFYAWSQKVLDLYRASLAAYPLTIVRDGRSRLGAPRYRVVPAT